VALRVAELAPQHARTGATGPALCAMRYARTFALHPITAAELALLR
jgi:hypothetical protein